MLDTELEVLCFPWGLITPTGHGGCNFGGGHAICGFKRGALDATGHLSWQVIKQHWVGWFLLATCPDK
eukprot:12569569-Prorocentrum_lima.AAC.1